MLINTYEVDMEIGDAIEDTLLVLGYYQINLSRSVRKEITIEQHSLARQLAALKPLTGKYPISEEIC